MMKMLSIIFGWKTISTHHDWRVPKYCDKLNLKDLFEMFKSVQGRRKLSLEERLIITLRICGGRFHYSHEHKSVIKLIENHNEIKDFCRKNTENPG
jgi:hypothetical protein